MRGTQSPGRVLILSADGTAVGGVTRVTMSLTKLLRRRGWDIQMVYPSGIERPLLELWAAQSGLEVVCSDTWPAPNKGRVKSVWELFKLIRNANVDTVNLHYGGSHIPLKDVIAVRAAGARRCVVSLHAPNPWSEAGPSRRVMTRLASYLCTSIAPCCGAVRNVIGEAGVPSGKVAVIPGGVSAPSGQPSKNDARYALGIPTDAFVVGSIVRMAPEKGIGYLIEALSQLDVEEAKIHLLIKGDAGPELPAMRALAASLLPGRWTFLDAEANNEQVFAATDLFALPSLLEGFPLVLMEAAFRALPVVATRVGSVGDLVIDGTTGLLVEPGNSVALAGAIRRLLSDCQLRTRMATDAKSRALEEFTEDLMATRYESLFCRGPRQKRG